ncbi:MAG: hypothetical protein PHP98_04575 [Kiritimatiellae bacterium]|nr:hypothetical protein [Kiritimatiellia bacterium]
MKLKSLTPLYGVNYKIGYIGFTFDDSSIVSHGIAYFTRWTRMSDIKVSHVLVVAGKNICIEAQMGQGVVKQPLIKYFNSRTTQIFFRKPRRYTQKIGRRIVRAAARQVGAQYDKLLIAAQAMQGCFLGRWSKAVFGDKPHKFIGRLLNEEDKWICSELAAYALDSQAEYRDKGVLKKPDFTIAPQELFEDDVIFCKWHKK